MRIDEITNILIEESDSGYSINLTGEQPTDGYMVGGEVESLIIKDDEPRRYTTIDAWLVNHIDLLHTRGYFAGVWKDTDTDLIYIDISRNVDDLYTALAMAEARGELAIWDVANGKEIRTEVNQVVTSDA